MSTTERKPYAIGFDLGATTVGYAVTDLTPFYNVLSYKGKKMWGAIASDAASNKKETGVLRRNRRNAERKKRFLKNVREIFTPAIEAEGDKEFFERRAESGLILADKKYGPYCLFNDEGYTDKEFHKQFPTIHHLIAYLMEDNISKEDESRYARLVCIACSWLLVHRGHFLNEIDTEKGMPDFKDVYDELMKAFAELPFDEGYIAPWNITDTKALMTALKMKAKVKEKTKAVSEALFKDGKLPKDGTYPVSIKKVVALLAGGETTLENIFLNADYKDFGKFDLNKSDEDCQLIFDQLTEEEARLLASLRDIFTWAILDNILAGNEYISYAKIEQFEQHNKDLELLRTFVAKYVPNKYDEIFNSSDRKGKGDGKLSYGKYTGHYSSSCKDFSKLADALEEDADAEEEETADETNEDEGKKEKKLNKLMTCEEYNKNLLAVFKGVVPDKKDKKAFETMITRMELADFLPKQVSGNNRVIPYQLYYKELKIMLANATKRIKSLNKIDPECNLTGAEKILCMMSFRKPYYYGPLNDSSKYSNIVRKTAGDKSRISFFNMDMVDNDATDERFLERLVGDCSYVLKEKALPNHSLLYERFTVLNEINCLKVNGARISVEDKQGIFTELFMKYPAVTISRIKKYLIERGYDKESAETISNGGKKNITSSLKAHIAFAKYRKGAGTPDSVLDDTDIANIIMHLSCCQDKNRMREWLGKNYPALSDSAKFAIACLKDGLGGRGNLSEKLLAGIVDTTDGGTGKSIIDMMWERNLTLAELLSSAFNYTKLIEELNDVTRKAMGPVTVEDILDESYVQNSARRSVHIAHRVLLDVIKKMGYPPARVFIGMARGGSEDQKGKTTKSRKDQILECYAKFKGNARVDKLRELLLKTPNIDVLLQDTRYYLYFLQLGKSMYSDTEIPFDQLKDIDSDGNYKYDKDHIWPKSKVKDDSILNNLVLCSSFENKTKDDKYPVDRAIQKKMRAFWKELHDHELISDVKFARLVRTTDFDDMEKMDFINRQLVETRQATKAFRKIVSFTCSTEVVCIKDPIISEFRGKYGITKVRSLNILHNATDAYLNVVCGNSYGRYFAQEKFIFGKPGEKAETYSISVESFFDHTRKITHKDGDEIVWIGKKSDENSSDKYVVPTAWSTDIRTANYAYIGKGQFWAQKYSPAGKNLMPQKEGKDPGTYGGYSVLKNAFFYLVRCDSQKKGTIKTDLIFVPVAIIEANKCLADNKYALNYCNKRIRRIFDIKEDTETCVNFVMGNRPIKLGSTLSLDGLEVAFSLTTGQNVGFKVLTPLTLPTVEDINYVRSVEKFYDKGTKVLACKKSKEETEKEEAEKVKVPKKVEKEVKRAKIPYDKERDTVTSEDNLALYDLFIDKLSKPPFCYRPSNFVGKLKAAREDFSKLCVYSQCESLMKILTQFGRVAVKDEVTGAGTNCRLSLKLSNWKKAYKDVRLIDRSLTGLDEVRSGNILDLFEV